MLPKHLGAFVAVHIGPSDSASNFSDYSKYARLELPFRLGLRVASPASKVRLEPHILIEKMLQMKTRQSLTLSGPKKVGIKSNVVRTQETMLLSRTRRLTTLPRQDSAGVESEVIRTEEKLLQGLYVV